MKEGENDDEDEVLEEEKMVKNKTLSQASQLEERRGKVYLQSYLDIPANASSFVRIASWHKHLADSKPPLSCPIKKGVSVSHVTYPA